MEQTVSPWQSSEGGGMDSKMEVSVPELRRSLILRSEGEGRR